MDNNTNISILITDSNNILAVDSLKQQTFDKFECFLMNNSIEQINNHIDNDHRFHIIQETDIHHAIEQIKSDYIIIAKADDVFISTALEYISRTIYLTNADVINFKVQPFNIQALPKSYKLTFNYICQKDKIFEHIFDDLSCFCIKREILLKTNDFSTKHLVVFNALQNAKDITTTVKTYILQNSQLSIIQETKEYTKIVDNFINNKNCFSIDFWKNYFAKIIVYIIKQTIQQNDRNTFIYFAKKIPLQLLPFRYRFMCWILKKTNK